MNGGAGVLLGRSSTAPNAKNPLPRFAGGPRLYRERHGKRRGWSGQARPRGFTAMVLLARRGAAPIRRRRVRPGRARRRKPLGGIPVVRLRFRTRVRSLPARRPARNSRCRAPSESIAGLPLATHPPKTAAGPVAAKSASGREAGRSSSALIPDTSCARNYRRWLPRSCDQSGAIWLTGIAVSE